MATGEIMGTSPPRATPARTGKRDRTPPKPRKKVNISVLKRMVEDDDDSSSSDDERAKPIEKEKVVRESDAREQETRARRSSKTATKEREDNEPKQPNSRKTKKPVETPLVHVRSERLQIREAMIQSTTAKPAVVTPDEKAKAKKTEALKETAAPRKRRRTSSSDSVVAEANDDTKQPPAKRLTRKNSREATKKETEKPVETVTPADAVIEKDDLPEAAKAQGVDEPVENVKTPIAVDPPSESKVEDKAATESSPTKDAVTKLSNGTADSDGVEKTAKVMDGHEESAIELKSTRRKRPRGKVGDAVKEDKKSAQPKRRSKVISDESESEAEFQPAGIKSENAENTGNKSENTGNKSENTGNKSENIERKPSEATPGKVSDADVKRKRLKRPLSAASANGSKSMSLGALLDREKPAVQSAKLVTPSKETVQNHKVAKKGKTKLAVDNEARRDTTSAKRSVENSHDSKSTGLRTKLGREDRASEKHSRLKSEDEQIKSRAKKKGASAALGSTLDDYIKEHENRQSLKLRKAEGASATSESQREGSETTADDKQQQASTDHERRERGQMEEACANDSERVQLHDRDGPDVKAAKSDDASHADRSTPTDGIPSHIADGGSIPSEPVPGPTTARSANEPEEDEEEGAVSDQEIPVSEEPVVKTSADLASASEGHTDANAPDPMSFVIPKKRPASVNTVQSSPNKAKQAQYARPQSSPMEKVLPGPSPSPVSSVEMNFTMPEKPKTRTKNAVPPKMLSLSQQEKDFFRLAEKSNSLLKAASITNLGSAKASRPRLVSAFGCTSDRYGVMLESGKKYVESTARMTCPTRKEIKNSGHPPSFFGVAMETPPGGLEDTSEEASENQVSPASSVPCYETLEFEKAEDRDWYLKRMYGTTFVPQLLRERVTLVMRNARYIRKATGLQFNAQRDKEEFAFQIAERYTVNRSVPRCDILQKNWQLLANGRVTFVFLHYMNREDALIARAQFKDDDGQPLIIKGESRANEAAVTSGMRPGMSPGMSPPPVPSPQPPRRRSRSRSSSPSRRLNPHEQRGRELERDRAPSQWHADGPRPPRDRSRGRRRGGRDRRSSSNGPNAPNGGRYGPRPPSRSRSRSPPRSGYPVSRPLSPQSSQQERQHSGQNLQSSQDSENQNDFQQSCQPHSSQSSKTTQDKAMTGQAIESSDQGGDHHRHVEMDHGPDRRRPPSRSRSRPHVPDDRPPPPQHFGRRGSEDQSFQRDRRSSGEYYSQGRDGRYGRSPPTRMQFDQDGRDRHGRDFSREQQLHDRGRFDETGPPPREFDRRDFDRRDFDRREHKDAGPHRRPYPHEERRFR